MLAQRLTFLSSFRYLTSRTSKETQFQMSPLRPFHFIPILKHHGKCLLTVTIFVSFMYGEKDFQTLPGMLMTAESGQTKIHLGTNSRRVKSTYLGSIVAVLV